MSITDQCPSTHGSKAKAELPGAAELHARSRDLPRVNGTGPKVWRSLDEVADTSEFREHLEKEFPHGALEMQRAFEAGGETRREFLKVMGASMALAGAATIPGCRRPEHKILTFSREVPEEVIPGKALYYATAMPVTGMFGGAEGLLVETHEGRPTKIEGNPLHPNNAGRASSWALASILGLYDPDRVKTPMYENPARGRLDATWDDFRKWAGENFSKFDSTQGDGLAFVVEKKSGVTRDAVKADVLKRWPKAKWVAYDPMDSMGAVEGSVAAFGAPMREKLTFSLEKTRVILSLDRDVLFGGGDEVSNSRQFATTRRVNAAKDQMSRVYAVESGLSLTGGQADHRLRLAPSRVSAFAVAFASFLLPKLAGPEAGALASALEGVSAPGFEGEDKRFLEECAKDFLLPENRGKSLVVAGETQPAGVHALVHAINAALGNVGNSVSYLPLSDELASNSLADFKGVVDGIASGSIKTMVVVEANPVYSAPGEWDLPKVIGDAKKKGFALVTLAVGVNETAELSTWVLNGSGYLEAWGDVRSADGTISPVQPMIEPLYAPAMSEIEFLALLANKDTTARVDGFEIVRAAWRSALKVDGADFEKVWRRALHDGLVANSAAKPAAPAVKLDGVAKAISAMKLPGKPGPGSLEAVFALSRVGDGRYANTAWLQELPQYGTMVVWDNPALMSPATAKELGLAPDAYNDHDPNRIYTEPKYPMAKMAEFTIDGKALRMPVWILPGMADHTVIFHVGYGRTSAGLVGDGVGVNVFAARAGQPATRATTAAFGVKPIKSSGEYMIASTQNHWSMEGRTSIVRAVDLPAFQKFGEEKKAYTDRFYGTDTQLNFAERLGELTHTPPNISIYKNPYNDSKEDAADGSKFSVGPQWGMTIDLSACSGCGACTVACQAENNIPVVGKKETAKGREMTWIRVDRYFVGDDFNNPDSIYHQPVACVHCENAPCEVVCPVNATVHGPEGLNYMTYNRCIGTRYCANNCPYKVRRYNFFEYGKLKFNGGYLGKDTLDKLGDIIPGQGVGPTGSAAHNKINLNFIPPRLRDKIDEIERMGKNPNVSVRMRGVMEKCSYCVQRINAAKIECKLKDIKGADGKTIVPDGFFQSACQQACPSEAIVFGDILDQKSKVHATRNGPRSYMLLGYLNTRPRTTHLVRVMNPNPNLCTSERKHSWENPFHHGGGHGDSHGAEKKGDHAFFYDRKKYNQDRGYAMSLSVLTNGAKA